tara:strand:- start:942 stop:1166 length:225 start_codon:yes stop_codon:yes gene_type:complete
MTPEIKEVLIKKYETNYEEIKKHKIWLQKQQDIFYNTGRPLFTKKINYETKTNPPNLWFLYENKYKAMSKKFNI